MSQFNEIESEVESLVSEGRSLYDAMLNDLGRLDDDSGPQQDRSATVLPVFVEDYDPWYSEALRVVKQVLPERLEDFREQYRNTRRKSVSSSNYGISDYLLNLTFRRPRQRSVSPEAAIPKMRTQVSILRGAQRRFRSHLFDVREIVQADLFDSELAAARELTKNGFVTGGGAIAGVVLEKHLAHVCRLHGLKSRKKSPSISDYNELLKGADIADTSKWRFIQHLGDLRNLCVHHKEKKPNKQDVLELVEGVEKVVKTLS